jgi:hypothetical protein
MEISIVPEFHAKDIASWLQVYVPGKPDMAAKGKANEPFKFELTEADASTTLCVWWYTHRLFRLDKFIDAGSSRETKENKTRLVMVEETYQRAGTGETLLGNGSKFTLLDIERQIVARGQVKSTFDPLPGQVLEAKGAHGGELWLSIVNRLHQEDARFSDTNVTELPRHTFGSVVSPFGTMPMWAYSFFASIRARNAVAEYGDTLKSLFANACYLVFVDPDKFDQADRDTRIEVMCQMQCLATIFMVYARDSSMRLGADHLVDDWTRIADAPDHPSMVVYDCEDGSEEAMCQSMALRLARGLSGPLASLQGLELLYYSCFGIVTLRLGSTDKLVYHAVLLKFDRRFLQRKLGLKVDAKEHPELPPCLLETTAFTTSNWKHRSKAYTEQSYRLVEQFAEANSKVSAEMVIQQGLYGHLLSLTCPELLGTHRIGQIECVYRGKLGVPVAKLMLNSADAGIELVSCLTDSDTIRATMTNVGQLLPETKMLFVPPDYKGAPRRESYTVYPRAQFVVRNRDFETPEIKSRVLTAAANMGSKVAVESIVVYADIGGYCISVA